MRTVRVVIEKTKCMARSAIPTVMGARRHGQEGALAPLPFWECCKVFLCISSYSKTLSKRIIYALFSQPVVDFWRLRHLWTALGTFVPKLLICSPLEKILRAPMPTV